MIKNDDKVQRQFSFDGFTFIDIKVGNSFEPFLLFKVLSLSTLILNVL